jgi:hypothetical protein
MFGIVIYKCRIYPCKEIPSVEEILTEKRLSGSIFEVREDPPTQSPDPEWVLGLRKPHSRLTRIKRRWPA